MIDIQESYCYKMKLWLLFIKEIEGKITPKYGWEILYKYVNNKYLRVAKVIFSIMQIVPFVCLLVAVRPGICRQNNNAGTNMNTIQTMHQMNCTTPVVCKNTSIINNSKCIV